DDTLEPAAFRDLGVAQLGMQLGADEVVVVPERRVALLRAPLIVAEDDHRDARPFLAADGAHLAHRDAEGAIAGEADDGRVRAADLSDDHRREAVSAGTEEARREILPALLESRIGVADRTVVADVAGNDRFLR